MSSATTLETRRSFAGAIRVLRADDSVSTGLRCRPMRKVVVLIAAVGALATPALAGTPDTKRLVLQAADVPTAFALSKARYVSNPQAIAIDARLKVDYNVLGRIRGYEVTYNRNAATGLIEIGSKASTYTATSGAHKAFVVVAEALRDVTSPRFHLLAVGAPLGDESRAFKATRTDKGISLDIFVVYWRTGRVTATTLALSSAGSVDAAKVLALARKQQHRIAAAT